MGTKQTAIENLKKAHKSPSIGKHGPWLKTLEENRQRERYLQKIAVVFEEITDAQISAALDPLEGEKDRKEIIHQFVGKPVEQIEIKQVTLRLDV